MLLKEQTTPIDRVLTHGTDAISTTDLLTMFVGEEATASLMQYAQHNLFELGKLTVQEMASLPYMTKRKAATLTAVLEIGRRRASTMPKDCKAIVSSADVAEYLKHALQDLQHEVFVVLFLNRTNKIIHTEKISSGGITGTVADPRIILKTAVQRNAVSLILSHNHPSGSLKPSRADEELTVKIKEAGKFFDIKVLDHIIISQDGYYSFADEGLL